MSASTKTVIRNDLNKYLDKRVIIKFLGGRQVSGVLKGMDDIVNVVLDDCRETLRDASGELTEYTRNLGLLVARGTGIIMICSEDGCVEISNPFVDQEGPQI